MVLNLRCIFLVMSKIVFYNLAVNIKINKYPKCVNIHNKKNLNYDFIILQSISVKLQPVNASNGVTFLGGPSYRRLYWNSFWASTSHLILIYSQDFCFFFSFSRTYVALCKTIYIMKFFLLFMVLLASHVYIHDVSNILCNT